MCCVLTVCVCIQLTVKHENLSKQHADVQHTVAVSSSLFCSLVIISSYDNYRKTHCHFILLLPNFNCLMHPLLLHHSAPLSLPVHLTIPFSIATLFTTKTVSVTEDDLHVSSLKVANWYNQLFTSQCCVLSFTQELTQRFVFSKNGRIHTFNTITISVA